MIPGILVELPVRTKNPLNGQRGNSAVAHAIKARERAEQRDLAELLVAAALKRRSLTGAELAPVVVTLTRVSVGTMDDDGLAASMKGIRDGIAKALGIDDGDRARLRYCYRQRKGPKGQHRVFALIEHRDLKPANVSSATTAAIQPPLPSFAVPRFPAAGKGCECPSVPRAVALPFDDRDFGDPERRAWWSANWKRIAWRAHPCPDCGAGWYVRELLEQEPATASARPDTARSEQLSGQEVKSDDGLAPSAPLVPNGSDGFARGTPRPEEPEARRGGRDAVQTCGRGVGRVKERRDGR